MTDWPEARRLYEDLTRGPKLFSADDFEAVLSHPGTRVLGAWDNRTLLSMATLHILPNVTFGGRPYALVENVVTAARYRGRGYGRCLMRGLVALAWENDVYKIMLLTGQKRQASGFYEACGFSSEDKHAMVMRRT